MHLIFDTSAVIEIERGNKIFIKEIFELKKSYPAPPKIPFIVYYELIHGIRKRNPKNKSKVERLINAFKVLHTTNKTARNLSQLKDKYEFPLSDLLIAAQLMEIEGILITKDKDFNSIKEINCIIL